jgi:hypothetical protein
MIKGNLNIVVTEAVIAQVAEQGHNQAQIALRNYAFQATREARLWLVISHNGAIYGLCLGDHAAVWRSHCLAAHPTSGHDFDDLYNILAAEPEHEEAVSFVAFDAMPVVE